MAREERGGATTWPCCAGHHTLCLAARVLPTPVGSPPSHPRFPSSSCSSQKFEDPAEGEEALKAKFKALNEEIRERFRTLEEEYR